MTAQQVQAGMLAAVDGPIADALGEYLDVLPASIEEGEDGSFVMPDGSRLVLEYKVVVIPTTRR